MSDYHRLKDKLAAATPDSFAEARGVPAPLLIWLIYCGAGETTWHTGADPNGEGDMGESK